MKSSYFSYDKKNGFGINPGTRPNNQSSPTSVDRIARKNIRIKRNRNVSFLEPSDTFNTAYQKKLNNSLKTPMELRANKLNIAHGISIANILLLMATAMQKKLSWHCNHDTHLSFKESNDENSTNQQLQLSEYALAATNFAYAMLGSDGLEITDQTAHQLMLASKEKKETNSDFLDEFFMLGDYEQAASNINRVIAFFQNVSTLPPIEVINEADEIAKLLNSACNNLVPGNSSTNSSIGSYHDPAVVGLRLYDNKPAIISTLPIYTKIQDTFTVLARLLDINCEDQDIDATYMTSSASNNPKCSSYNSNALREEGYNLLHKTEEGIDAPEGSADHEQGLENHKRVNSLNFNDYLTQYQDLKDAIESSNERKGKIMARLFIKARHNITANSFKEYQHMREQLGYSDDESECTENTDEESNLSSDIDSDSDDEYTYCDDDTNHYSLSHSTYFSRHSEAPKNNVTIKKEIIFSPLLD